jgi:hypothetical protein
MAWNFSTYIICLPTSYTECSGRLPLYILVCFDVAFFTYVIRDLYRLLTYLYLFLFCFLPNFSRSIYIMASYNQLPVSWVPNLASAKFILTFHSILARWGLACTTKTMMVMSLMGRSSHLKLPQIYLCLYISAKFIFASGN